MQLRGDENTLLPPPLTRDVPLNENKDNILHPMKTNKYDLVVQKCVYICFSCNGN